MRSACRPSLLRQPPRSIYIGSSSSVTTATGHLLKAGESISFSNMPDAVYAIAASGTPTITLVEWTR